MSYFRKDGSLDTILVGSFYPPISEIDKFCKTVLSFNGQYIRRKDGGVKVYLFEKEEGEDGFTRNFFIPKKILAFDEKPLVFLEVVEHADFVNGKKKMIHIFADRIGNPFIPFFIPRLPQKHEGHVYFSIREGYEIIVFVEENSVKIQLVEIKMGKLDISPNYSLIEKGEYLGLLSDRLPNKFFKFEKAVKAASEKFFCKDCVHPHFFLSR